MSLKKKSRLFLFLIVFVSITGLVGYYLISYKAAIKQDETLLEPQISLNSSERQANTSFEESLNAILLSIKDAQNELPTSSILPEFTAEQSRPSRSLIKSAIIASEKTLLENSLKIDEDFVKSLKTFDLAFKEIHNPQYLDYVLEIISKEASLSIESVLEVLKSVVNQKKAIPYINSENYISFMTKAVETIENNCQKIIDPITAIKLYQCTVLLPKKIKKSNFEAKLKIILEDAFFHKNATRNDGYFLSSDESTLFSLELINTAWQSYLDQEEMPKWLYQLAEKEACRLAFRLEPDGCLPDWLGKNQRDNLRSEIYKAAVVFDRDDLRFIAYGGTRMQDTLPPLHKNYHFPEIGEAIIRTNWNIYHFSNPIQNNYLAFQEECFQVTYNSRYKRFSIYAATAHLGILESEIKAKEDKVKIHDNSLHVNDLVVQVTKEDKLIIINFKNTLDMKFFQLGKMYLLQDEKILFYDRSYYLNDWARYKPLWSCEINKDEFFTLVLKSAWKNKLMRR